MSLGEEHSKADLDAIESDLDQEMGFRDETNDSAADKESAQESFADGYHPDPDDDPAQRHSVAARDASALVRAAWITSAVCVIGCGLLSLLGVPGMHAFTRGFAIGALVSTVNLRILANASWSVFNGRVFVSLLGFGVSFASLLAVAFWLTRTYPQWSLGFGVGLSLPGVAGLLYAIRQGWLKEG